MMSVKSQRSAIINSNNDLNYQQLWGLKLFGGGMSGVLKLCINEVEKRREKPFWIATVNPEFVMESDKDPKFRQILEKTDLNTIDGVGLAWVLQSGILEKKNRAERLWAGFVTGVEILQGKHREMMAQGADLVVELSKLAAEKGWRVFLLGGFGDRAKRAGERLMLMAEAIRESPLQENALIVETCEGSPKVNNEEVLKKINEFKPDLLFVAYGMKKQEEWISDNASKIDVGVAMGVGRTFDYLSGDLQRAPDWVRKLGFEWFYSLIKEPKRATRQLELVKFIWKVLVG